MKINVEENKENILNMFEGMDEDTSKITEFLIGSDYFECPASTQYHLNCRGGLAQHSLNVTNMLMELVQVVSFNCEADSIYKIGLLHDICKVNTYKVNRLKKGGIGKKPYFVDDEIPLGHGEKSAMIAQKYIDLTNQEILAIRWHMGNFDPSFRQYQYLIDKTADLVWLTHYADNIAAKYIDPKYEGEII